MAMQDNELLPAATGAGGMNPQLQAFLNLLMGGGLHGFGGFGGQPFGGFGQFLMNNPGLMRGLGLIPHGAVPGPLPGAAPVEDSTTPVPGSQLGAARSAVEAAIGGPPNVPTSLLSTSETPGLLKASTEHPAADIAAGGGPFSTPGALPNLLTSGFVRPGGAPFGGPGTGTSYSGQPMPEGGGGPSSVLPLPMLRKG